MTTDKVLDQLVSLTSLPPSIRYQMSIGQARTIMQEQADFIHEGWPAAYFHGFPTDAWTDLRILQSDARRTTTVLRHGNDLSTSRSRFEWTCDGTYWALSNFGPDYGENSSWYEPAPPALPGQDGPLTEQLALRLLDDMLVSYGRTRMRVTATGNALERGRLFVVSGGNVKPRNWGVKGLTLQQETADRVIAVLKDEKGAPMDTKVLFTRVGGLWKIADNTDGQNWAPVKYPGFSGPRDGFDSRLLGLRLGMTQAEVQALAGRPDSVVGSRQVYSARRLSVEYDTAGKVKRISAGSGSTERGLTIGAPIDSIGYLYGEPDERRPDAFVYAGGRQRMTIRVATSSGSYAGPFVSEFVLESLN